MDVMPLIQRVTTTAAMALVGLLVSGGGAHAALHARAGGMVYDDVYDITWLSDMDTNGGSDWATANSWANDLTHGGFTEWRLPTLTEVDNTCSKYIYPRYFNCTGGELSNLFVTYFGYNDSVFAPSETQEANRALFKNEWGGAYWSGVEVYMYDEWNLTGAWYFYAQFGSQGFADKNDFLSAVAVHPGDIAPVPEPQAYALLVVGLGLLALAARRYRPN